MNALGWIDVGESAVHVAGLGGVAVVVLVLVVHVRSRRATGFEPEMLRV